MLRRLGIASILLITLTACGSQASPKSTTTSAPVAVAPATGGTIKWGTCKEKEEVIDRVQCARFEVPFDYSDPSKGSFSLKLMRMQAPSLDKQIGTLLVNPGGPGFGGTYLVANAYSYFSQEIIDRFQIVAWDPRGTGESTPYVDCVDNYDEYFTTDPTPENDQQHQALIDASKKFSEECGKKNKEILPYISTNNTVRDMDKIRAALGEEKITYFGFSYGSELGATWATMFPTTVRAAVLDGAADPEADYMEGGLQQAAGFEKQLTIFLSRCSADPDCAFYNSGKAEEAFDALMIKVDKNPIVVTKSRTAVNQSVAYTAVSQAMYSSSMWTQLETALHDAQMGNGRGLLDLYDSYYQRNPDGTYGNELEAFNAILCVDDPGPMTVEETDSYLPAFKKAAPRLWPGFTAGYGCVFWPVKPDPRIKITGKGAGPIIVVGTTGDAATPLKSSRNMAAALEDGRLIVVTADRHTGYGENNCVTSAVDNYLITAKVTFREKAC